MAIPALGLIAAIAGISGASWVSRNVLGTDDWLNQYFSPRVVTPPNTIANRTISASVTDQYLFRVQVLAPSDADIKALDDFFESYGYRVDRTGKPNLKVRDNFTYVKTRDAVVKSNVMQASQQMAAMLNSGTKFWIGDIGNV